MKPSFAAHTPNSKDQWHPLNFHLTKVATRAQIFASKFGADEVGYYAGLWHDLGKYNPAFQKYLEDCDLATQMHLSAPQERVPHAKYGAKLAAAQFAPLAPLIYGHHAGLPSRSYIDRLAEIDSTIYQAILENARIDSLKLDVPPKMQEQFMNLFEDKYHYELLLRVLFSCLIDSDYLDTELHFSPDLSQRRSTQITVSSLWDILKPAQEQLLIEAIPSKVNQVRSQVHQACVAAASLKPGVFRLAVPTGGGKTRSGLAFALFHAVQHQLDRVIIAVPYTSIIEQTVEVYRKIFGAEAVLEHHSAVKPEEGNEEDARSHLAQARLATQNWDAPLVVTTTVQLFESLFANRTSRCRKLHNIVRSVIILDEVQTLPVRLLKPIVNVLQALCERYSVSVVLCTATQPALEGQSPYLQGFPTKSVRDIISPEIAKRHFAELSRVAYAVPSEPQSWDTVAQDVQQQKQALIVLNTRRDALEVFDRIGTGTEHLFHLSTLLCGQHRREVLEQVRDRLHQNQPCFLVSTQVVEAGVDLDFPIVYRAIAPLDRIVQAAGRCNREGRLEQGRVIVFQPEDGKLPPGEYAKAVKETAILLKRENLDWNDPTIFEQYFRRLYQGLDTDANQVQSARHALDFPEVAARFKLIPDDTNSVVVEYDDRAAELVQKIRCFGLKSGNLQKLQPYFVSLRSREFQQTEALRELIAPGIWLWHGGYDQKKGIAISNDPILRDPTDLIV